jgi:hypothetical protein
MNLAGGIMVSVLVAQSGGTPQPIAKRDSTDWPM